MAIFGNEVLDLRGTWFLSSRLSLSSSSFSCSFFRLASSSCRLCSRSCLILSATIIAAKRLISASFWSGVKFRNSIWGRESCFGGVDTGAD